MKSDENIVGAFSAEHAERLSGVSRHQLRRWDSLGFFEPSYADGSKGPFSRVYSFKDLVALRVLNVLRNEHGISLQHLREVARKLAYLADERWTATTLYVLGKKVVFLEPGTSKKREIVSGQYVADIPLKVAVSSARKAVAEYNKRRVVAGQINKSRFVAHNAPVLAGTRTPVEAIKRFAAAGYGEQQILREYPDLTEADVRAALAYEEIGAAA